MLKNFKMDLDQLKGLSHDGLGELQRLTRVDTFENA